MNVKKINKVYVYTHLCDGKGNKACRLSKVFLTLFSTIFQSYHNGVWLRNTMCDTILLPN